MIFYYGATLALIKLNVQIMMFLSTCGMCLSVHGFLSPVTHLNGLISAHLNTQISLFSPISTVPTAITSLPAVCTQWKESPSAQVQDIWALVPMLMKMGVINANMSLIEQEITINNYIQQQNTLYQAQYKACMKKQNVMQKICKKPISLAQLTQQLEALKKLTATMNKRERQSIIEQYHRQQSEDFRLCLFNGMKCKALNSIQRFGCVSQVNPFIEYRNSDNLLKSINVKGKLQQRFYHDFD